MSKIGDRVGAVASMEGNKAYLLGYGTYVGDEIPVDAIGFTAELARGTGRKNPKIVLDGGKHVWGCECWWGPEERVKKALEGKEVVSIDIDELRSEYAPKH